MFDTCSMMSDLTTGNVVIEKAFNACIIPVQKGMILRCGTTNFTFDKTGFLITTTPPSENMILKIPPETSSDVVGSTSPIYEYSPCIHMSEPDTTHGRFIPLTSCSPAYLTNPGAGGDIPNHNLGTAYPYIIFQKRKGEDLSTKSIAAEGIKEDVLTVSLPLPLLDNANVYPVAMQKDYVKSVDKLENRYNNLNFVLIQLTTSAYHIDSNTGRRVIAGNASDPLIFTIISQYNNEKFGITETGYVKEFNAQFSVEVFYAFSPRTSQAIF